MKLQRESIEYARWPVDGAPVDATFQARFGDGPDWHPMETVSATEIRLLLAGPDATTPGAAVVMSEGRTFVTIRLADSPEDIFRDGGTIDVPA